MADLQGFLAETFAAAREQNEADGFQLPSFANQPAWESYRADVAKLGARLDLTLAAHRSECVRQAKIRQLEHTLSAAKAWVKPAL